ncbi:NAD(P)H-dependent D-xylose reductase (XR) [Tulasnella sp. 417]|nr:NAD(P)H-dependent D-xylose reductase (XR) [Tulasnella sp. 417]
MRRADEIIVEKIPIQQTWEAMEEIVDEGLAKDIGLRYDGLLRYTGGEKGADLSLSFSNFNGALLSDVLRYATKPVSVLQIEHHPYLTQDKLINSVKSEGIAITAYSSFGPASWVEFEHQNVPDLLNHDTIRNISEATGKTPPQVLLRWATQRGIAVIAKSINENRLLEYLQSSDFYLTQEQIDRISALDINLRFYDPYDIDSRLFIFA